MLNLPLAKVEKRQGEVEETSVTVKGFTYDEKDDTLTAHFKEQNCVPYIKVTTDDKGKEIKELAMGSSIRINGRISEFTQVLPSATKQEIAALTNVPGTLVLTVFEGEIKKYFIPEISDAHINRVTAVRKLSSINNTPEIF